MANFLTSTREQILADMAESNQRDRSTIAALSEKYPEHEWRCCGNHVEASVVKNRRKHWVRSKPVDSHYQAAIGIGDWRVAVAEGKTHEEAIDRVVLRLKQMLKDTEVLYCGAAIDG